MAKKDKDQVDDTDGLHPGVESQLLGDNEERGTAATEREQRAAQQVRQSNDRQRDVAAGSASPAEPRNDAEWRAVCDRVRSFAAQFQADVPQEGRAGVYSAREGDRFDGVDYQIPDGTWRVEGWDWLFTFVGGHLAEAAIARPPNFGEEDGRRVRVIPADANAPAPNR